MLMVFLFLVEDFEVIEKIVGNEKENIFFYTSKIWTHDLYNANFINKLQLTGKRLFHCSQFDNLLLSWDLAGNN